MKLYPSLPQDQAFWYLNIGDVKPLAHDITTDVVVIGGGMAGLTAAYSFKQKGCSVVLIEKNYCGSGASGKTSGFITPDAELSLSELVDAYGIDRGHELWKFIEGGVNHIRQNITTHNLDCDYQVQDTCVVASSPKAFVNDLEEEYKARQKCGYSSVVYSKAEMGTVIGSDHYHGAIVYGNTFGIHSSRYCAHMRTVLRELGVQIYEETPALEVQHNIVITPQAKIKAGHIIMCTDHAASKLDYMKNMVYPMQNFLMISQPLSDKQVKAIFPDRPLMVWDTDLVYNYYRLTGENRLLLGGGSLWLTYAGVEAHNNKHMITTLSAYAKKIFPHTHIEWEYMWPGMIGISKDLFPVAGFDKDIPSLYYLTCAAGLPWAAALGMHSADDVINGNRKFDDLLSPYRTTTLGPVTQRFLGARLTFALSNYLVVRSL